MSQRFFSETPITGEQVELSGSEAHHLLHVMRLKAGAEVTLFDGVGAEFEAVISECGRRDVLLAVQARREVDRELPAELVIAAAVPKGDRQRWMVEKLTELGVSQWVPLSTERSVAKLSGGGLEKLRRAVIEASKQCRRNRLMEIAEPQSWEKFANRDGSGAVRLIAHPMETRSEQSLPLDQVADGATLAIGPEGGFTDEEIAQATENDWQRFTLGERILRTETAAIASATIAAHAMTTR